MLIHTKLVSVRNCENVICTVLENFANVIIECLPRKSIASRFMVESHPLAQMRVTEAVMQGDSYVLHLNRTKLNFEELGSFQMVTPSGSYTMSIKDMLTRQAECYLDIFRDLLKDMAAILVPAEEVDDKVNKLLLSIKNIMTDRVVTNKSLFT